MRGAKIVYKIVKANFKATFFFGVVELVTEVVQMIIFVLKMIIFTLKMITEVAFRTL